MDFREKCSAKIGIDIGLDVLLVTKVLHSGRVPAWNACHRDAEVREGDRICEVNGKNDSGPLQPKLGPPRHNQFRQSVRGSKMHQNVLFDSVSSVLGTLGCPENPCAKSMGKCFSHDEDPKVSFKTLVACQSANIRGLDVFCACLTEEDQ